MEEPMNRVIEARAQFWSSLGEMDMDVLTHLINPAFLGGPRWPTMHQAYLKVERPHSVLLASDGLSDPFEDEQEANVGFGIECYVDSDEPELRTALGKLRGSWQFQLLYQVAQNAAHLRVIKEELEQYEVIALEVYDVNVPQNFISPEGRVGTLLGIDAPGIPREINTPEGSIRLVSIKLLTLPELAYITQYGEDGRKHLAELFRAQGSYHLSSLKRKSVVFGDN